ncbi:transposase [Bradyrhizobium sp. 17]|nr:transposase [Bradyrhizobium sp. 17]
MQAALIAATPEGKKELIGFQVGMREGTQSRRELLIDVKQRGLHSAVEIAVGDGALGFWNVPLSIQAAIKEDLGEVHRAPNRRSRKWRSTSLQRNTAPARAGGRMLGQGSRECSPPCGAGRSAPCVRCCRSSPG